MLLALSFRADAQQPGKVPRIGFLTTGSACGPSGQEDDYNYSHSLYDGRQSYRGRACG